MTEKIDICQMGKYEENKSLMWTEESNHRVKSTSFVMCVVKVMVALLVLGTYLSIFKANY